MIYALNFNLPLQFSFFLSSSLVARAHTIKLWRSGVSRVQTLASTYNMQYPYQLSKAHGDTSPVFYYSTLWEPYTFDSLNKGTSICPPNSSVAFIYIDFTFTTTSINFCKSSYRKDLLIGCNLAPQWMTETKQYTLPELTSLKAKQLTDKELNYSTGCTKVQRN